MNNVEPNQKTNDRIGCCIYCGAIDTNLTTEHIYPKCLHSQESIIYWTLNNAVCCKCQKITHEIDSYMCEKHLRDYRFLTQKKSRSKYKNYSSVKTVRAKRQGKIIKIKVDIATLGWLYLLPVYSMPEIVSKGIQNEIKGFQKLDHINQDKLKAIQTKYDIEAIEYNARLKDELFMRFLAKVAYGFAVLEHGYEYLKDSPLLPIILGESTKEAKRLIGTHDTPTFTATDTVGFKNYGDKNNSIRYMEMKILKGNVPIYVVIYKT